MTLDSGNRDSMKGHVAVAPTGAGRPGAVVSGINAASSGPEQVESLKQTLTEHGVIVLRNQTLPPLQFVHFAQLFGEIEPSTREQFWHPEEPQIYVISNVVENGKLIGNPNDGFGWHTDQYYFERPTAYTFLYGIETPPEGADTEFCGTGKLYDELSAEDKERYDQISIRASHTALNQGRLHSGQEERYPDVVHKLVRKHPISGRDFLYFSSEVTGFPYQMEEDKFRRMQKMLLQKATHQDRVYSHRWRVNDLVIWDNRGLLHRATSYDKARYRRICHRISVLGEKPLGTHLYEDH